jgi:hypothetical protein
MLVGGDVEGDTVEDFNIRSGRVGKLDIAESELANERVKYISIL